MFNTFDFGCSLHFEELGSRCANGLLLDPTPAVDSGMGKELALHSRIIAMYLSLWHLSALIIGCQQLISILVHHIHFLKYTHKNPQIYKTGTKKNINNNKMKDFCMSDQ